MSKKQQIDVGLYACVGYAVGKNISKIINGSVKLPNPLKLFGTPGWIRTSDLQLRRLTPYPLGYGRTFKTSGGENKPAGLKSQG